MKSENKDIRTTDSISDIVECSNSQIYGTHPTKLISFFDSLPSIPYFHYLKVLAVPHLFESFENFVVSDEEPIKWFKELLLRLKINTEEKLEDSTYISWLETEISSLFYEDSKEEEEEEEVKANTGNHYGNLFKNFDNNSYFDEAKLLLQIRLKRNGIEIPNSEKCRLLDQGCGGGRYTCAWKLLGIDEAVGLDFSEIAIEDARKRLQLSGLDKVSFEKGSVLDMPYQNESFDIVFSNGVLHHTEDWQKGISEQIRVLKPGGFGWLYLIEHPGGIFWDMIEILRAILRGVNKNFAITVLKSLNIPDNRIFYMLDHVMVPINTRLTPEQIEKELHKNGASSIKRLSRGTDFDRIEYIHNKIPYAKEKFGVGENRYFFRK